MPEFEEITEEIIRQRHWTEAELKANGYEYYERKKEVTMARVLPKKEAPKYITTSSGDKLIAEAGYMICYKPGDKLHATLDSYEHWPVEPSIFRETYKPWDDPNWDPSPTEAHLVKLGCHAYFKSAGVWAKRIMTDDVMLQSKEHRVPVRVKTGDYVVVGAQGEPYKMGSSTLHTRYISRRNRFTRWLKRLFRR